MSPEERQEIANRAAAKRSDRAKSKAIDTLEVRIWNSSVEDARTAIRFIEAHGGRRRRLREFLQ